MIQPNFKLVFVVTYGRTGSTLLQGILNSVEGVVITGENGGYIYNLYSAYKTLEYLGHQTRKIKRKETTLQLIQRKITNKKQSGKEDSPTLPFFGSSFIDLNAEKRFLLGRISKYFKSNLNCNKATVTGFKEVRYHMLDIDQYLDFLQEHFGPACFVFLTRNAEQVAQSGFYKKKSTNETLLHIEEIEKRFFKYIRSQPDTCYWIDYENLKRDDERLRKLFDFIGLEFDQAKIERVLATPHSYDVQTFKPPA